MALSKPSFAPATKQWLTKALNYCKTTIMDIGQFAKVTEHPISQETFDMFYVSLMHGYPVYLSKETVKWFGYSGPSKLQKQKIVDILNTNYVKGVDWFEYSQNEYTQLYGEFASKYRTRYLENKTDPHADEQPVNADMQIFTTVVEQPNIPDPSGSGNRTMHIIINPKIFKKVVMRADSSKAEEIRDYYVNLEELVFMYMEYVLEMRKSTGLGLIEKLDQLNLTLKESNDERKIAEAKHDEERKKSEERFQALMDRTSHVQTTLEDTKDILVDISEEHVPKLGVPSKKYEVLIILKDPTDEDHPYYVIRTQKENINKSIKKIKDDYNDVEVLVQLNHPNSKKLWQSFKTRNGKYLVSTDSNWFGLSSRTSEERFVRGLTRLSERRKIVN